MSAHRAYVGVGANLGDRVASVERAIAALDDFGKVVRRSSLYRTAPWGKFDQPWFLNAVVVLETQLPPRRLLDSLQALEKQLGRTPAERWGPRAIDLDLLLYDDLRIDEPGLRVPHPRMRERAFVLVPLAEIDERFKTMRDALSQPEIAGVAMYEGPRSARGLGESDRFMPQGRSLSVGERIRALARFLAHADAVRVRVERGDDAIEISRRSRTIQIPHGGDGGASDASPHRIDAIKADLVGVFHLSRPAPVEGELFDGDRELGYIEALGIRTPVHSMGAGRLLSIASADGTAVEYGQPLFFVARGR
jgi:2-amino-4-hydroxy-6-hydroxymethyldihydropteridine diphosphokinase